MGTIFSYIFSEYACCFVVLITLFWYEALGKLLLFYNILIQKGKIHYTEERAIGTKLGYKH